MSFYEDRIFPHLLDMATRPFERDRRELVSQARGRILELGMGTGANIPCYTSKASEVTGIEPCAAMLEMARQRAAMTEGNTEFRFVEGGAEALPFDDSSFDTVIACLVFCTIPDNISAAAEAFRVLKPGGRLLVFEHVVSPSALVHQAQKLVNPGWQKLACGCQLTRDTLSVFRNAGFDTRAITSYRHPKVPALAGQVIKGFAVKP